MCYHKPIILFIVVTETIRKLTQSEDKKINEEKKNINNHSRQMCYHK